MAPVTFTQRSQIAAGLLIASGPVGDCLDKLLAGVNLVDDTQLASPTSAVWRTVLTSQGTAAASGITGAGVYYFTTTGANASGVGGTTVQGVWVPPAAGDIAVVGKTTRLRLRVAYLANATAPGTTMTWGLYPISSVAGGVNTITPTLGTVIAGSTAAVAPTASTANHIDSASFDASLVTAGSAYVIGLAVGAGMAANSLVSSEFFLEMRNT